MIYCGLRIIAASFDCQWTYAAGWHAAAFDYFKYSENVAHIYSFSFSSFKKKVLQHKSVLYFFL